jgi:hypothetical protein
MASERFATQIPKRVDNKIVSNCTTHVYGRMGSSATIDAIQDPMSAKGGAADDIGALQGRVLFFDGGLAAPFKVRTPWARKLQDGWLRENEELFRRHILATCNTGPMQIERG